MKKFCIKVISGFLALFLFISFGAPAFAIEATYSGTLFNQNGTTSNTEASDEYYNTLNTFIPQLNMTIFESIEVYGNLIIEFKAAKTPTEQEKIFNQLTKIVNAVIKTNSIYSFNEYDLICASLTSYSTNISTSLEFLDNETFELKNYAMLVKNDLREDKPELKLDFSKIQRYKNELDKLKTFSLSKSEQQKTIDILGKFKTAISDYKYNETLTQKINDVISFLAGNVEIVEQVIPKAFTDVPSNYWACSAIMSMAQSGYINGTYLNPQGIGTFSPNQTMTKAQFIAITTRILYNEELTAMETSSPWYQNNYNLAVDKGLITESEFPITTINNGMNRQEMAMVLVRAANLRGETISPLISTSKIPDYNAVNRQYQEYVHQAYSLGLLCGTDSKGTFAPLADMNRAQAATVLYRLINKDSRQSVDL